ncbi:RHS repeat-associated core domain-containing protein [Photorhabdus tasmaniensis]
MARDAAVSAGASSRSPCGEITRGSPNVFINSRPAAIATRSTVECSKEHGLRQMAEGSASVFINGYPAVRIGDKTVCDAAVMTGSPNVFIGGGTAQTANIVQEIPHWAYTVSDLTMFAAGLVSFGGAAAKGPGALQTLFSKVPGADKIRKIACRLGALAVAVPVAGILMNPVEAIAGQKFLHDEDELDFVFDAELPLYWQRSYLSRYQYDSVLGQGWSLFWESHLTRVDGGLLWRSPAGDIVPFPDVPAGHRCFCPEAQSALIHTPEDTWEIRDAGEQVYHYTAFDNDGISRLSHRRDNVGHEQRCHYNEQHQMVSITGSGGLKLHCDYVMMEHDNQTVSRLTVVWREWYDGHRIQLCRYHYNEHAQLTGVSHRNDFLQRQFGWTAQGLMAWHQDARGLRCDYQWEQTEEGLWRVLAQQTSEGAGYRLEYDDGNLTRTAHWYDNTRTVWRLNDAHHLIHCLDRTGTEHHILWDEFGLPNGYTDADGHTRLSEWDKHGRQLSFTDANGNQTGWQYQNDTDRLTFIFWPDGTETALAYDEFGRLMSETSPLKQTTRYHYLHRHTLRPARCTDAKGGESQFQWNEQGQLIRHADCSGQSTVWCYDKEYRLERVINALMESTYYHYDDNGQLVQVTYPDDSTEHMAWDSAGQLTHHQRNENAPCAWEYNAFGQVVCATDRLQRQIRYQYSPEGHLIQLDNANDDRYRLNRDAEGRLIEEIRPDDTLILYEYNAAGLLSTERRMGDRVFKYPERQVHQHYDAAGQLIQRETYTDTYQYRWDSMGRLLEARREPNDNGKPLGIVPSTVRFDYDALGRVIREQNGDDSLQFSYDELDNLTALTLPQGGTLSWLYYGSGHLSAIRHEQKLLTEFERDQLHRETRRTQGNLFQLRDYDPLGRCIHQYSLPLKQADADPRPYLSEGKPWRAWVYGPQDELQMMADHYRGMIDYLYDAESRLKKVTHQGSAYEDMLWYDRADNLLEQPQSILEREAEEQGIPKAVTPQGDRLSYWRQWRYEHDPHGNITRRECRWYKTQDYRYDGDNRLTVAKIGNTTAHYHYDALGRRIRKVVKIGLGGLARYEQTDFVWHGLRLLQERDPKSGETQTYCYESHDSYTPLASIVTRGARHNYYWYHTDINGAPLEVTNEEGKIAWAGKYRLFGELDGSPLAYFTDPALSSTDYDFRQNLRYAGQYFDNETGLHFNTFRYYAPETGRFITPDPIGLRGGLNPYSYVHNPANWIDPLGLTGCPNSIKYGELDHLGRPTGVHATLDKGHINTGTHANPDIQPPGFITGKGSNRARGHLLGRQLGGSGDNVRNLVTLQQRPANTPVMSGVEGRIRKALEQGEVVEMSSIPIYKGPSRIPAGITMKAEGSGGFFEYVTVLNPPGM